MTSVINTRQQKFDRYACTSILRLLVIFSGSFSLTLGILIALVFIFKTSPSCFTVVKTANSFSQVCYIISPTVIKIFLILLVVTIILTFLYMYLMLREKKKIIEQLYMELEYLNRGKQDNLLQNLPEERSEAKENFVC